MFPVTVTGIASKVPTRDRPGSKSRCSQGTPELWWPSRRVPGLHHSPPLPGGGIHPSQPPRSAAKVPRGCGSQGSRATRSAEPPISVSCGKEKGWVYPFPPPSSQICWEAEGRALASCWHVVKPLTLIPGSSVASSNPCGAGQGCPGVTPVSCPRRSGGAVGQETSNAG